MCGEAFPYVDDEPRVDRVGEGSSQSVVAPLVALDLSTTSQSICSFSGVHSTWTSVCDQCAYRVMVR